MPPYWTEIISGKQEFHITFNFNEDEQLDANRQQNKFIFVKTDEVFFVKRDEFWLQSEKALYTHMNQSDY